jgi:hypothetical protein
MASDREFVVRQATGKLLRFFPIAFLMFALSAGILWISLLRHSYMGTFVGCLAVSFFGPAFLIMAQGLVRPSYLRADEWGIQCRFYSVELGVPWSNIRAVTSGVGWPALTFHDPEAAARSAHFWGLLPLSWILEFPARIVSALVKRPIANVYPMTGRQLLGMYRANEKTFGFHYGMPTDALERPGREILAALRRWHARHAA